MWFTLPARALLLALALLAACTPAPPPAPLPVPLAASEVRQLAELLRLEDRREHDPEALRRAASATSARVRAHAALSLARLRDPAGMPLLLALLADRDTAVRATAAFALGQMGDTAAVAALLPALQPAARAGAPTVAAEAAYALGKLPGGASRNALRQLLAPPAPVDGADAALHSALLAAWRLPRAAERIPLLRWTEAADPETRWRAAYALVRRPDPAAVPRLLALVADPDERVRALAVRGLTATLVDSAGVARERAVDALLRAVDDEAYAVRVNAIRTLGTFADPRAVARLRALALAGGPHERLAATESLARLGTAARAAAPELAERAADPALAASLRAAALEALGQVEPTRAAHAAAALESDPEWRVRAAAARAAAAGPLGSETLSRLLRDPDARVAAAALEAFGSGTPPPPGLRGELLGALGHRDVFVRANALSALGRAADPALVPALLDAFQRAQADSLNDAALAAIDALAAVPGDGADAARAFFARFPRSPDPLVRLRARQRFGDAAAAWGEPLPIETGRSLAEYEQIVRRWMDPSRAPTALIETAGGTLALRLHAASAPLTVESFTRLARTGYFAGQAWPRVVPNFVVQGGDPRGDTNGGPGYAIRDEINRLRYGAGTLGMALSGADTGGSQFFFTHSPQPHLDGIYTIFGELVQGHSVAERILPGDPIVQVRIVP